MKPWSRLAHSCRIGAYPGFCSMRRLEVSLLPLDGILVHRRSLPRNLLGFPNNSPVPIYTPGWREVLRELSVLPKNTTQCPRPGLEPGPLDPWTSALTMRPPRLPHIFSTCSSPRIAVLLAASYCHLQTSYILIKVTVADA